MRTNAPVRRAASATASNSAARRAPGFSMSTCFPALAASAAMGVSAELLPEFDLEMASARRTLERIPKDKLAWKPHEKSMTLGRLAGHIAELPGMGVLVMKD